MIDEGLTTRQVLVNRQGSVLVVVVVVVLLLSLAAYRFAEPMVAEVEAAAAFHRDVEARAFADSGIELAAALLGDRSTEGFAQNLYNNPELFQGVLVRDAESGFGRGGFSVVAPDGTDLTGTTLRFGLIDESARLNVNVVTSYEPSSEVEQINAFFGTNPNADLRDVLLKLPQMTAEIADAILDWLDEDEQPRQFGAENEFYGTLVPPYSARNGRIESLDELLNVRGVTPWLLYGEDANRNGLLDTSENDGEATAPYDDADGVLWRGWSAYLTTNSREANRRTDGAPRIDVNQEDLAALYDQLLSEFGESTAQFVTAFRLFGPQQDQQQDSQGQGQSGGSGRSGSGGRGGGGSVGGGEGGGSGQSAGSTQDSPGQDALDPDQTGQGDGSAEGGEAGQAGGSGQDSGSGTNRGGRSSGSSGQGSSGGGDGGGGESGTTITRGGLDLSRGGGNQITSLYQLLGAQVTAEINGERQTLESPWASDGATMQGYLPDVLNKLTANTEEFIEGRININLAPREVLLTIPGIDEQVVEGILGAQAAGGGMDSASGTSGTRATTGWLVIEGLVDLPRMSELDQYITTRGDVYRTQVVGHYDAGGSWVRLEAVIDATRLAPRVVSVTDLTPLGRGLGPTQLGIGGGTGY